MLRRLRDSRAALDSTPKHGATPVSAAVQNDHLEVGYTVCMTKHTYTHIHIYPEIDR